MDRRDLRRIRLLQKFGEVARWTIGLGRRASAPTSSLVAPSCCAPDVRSAAIAMQCFPYIVGRRVALFRDI
jgi:hypothetical protein